MKNKILSLFIFSIGFMGFSQSSKDVKNITKDYDIDLIKKRSIEFKELEASEKARAYQYALVNNIPLSYTDKEGNFHQLMKLTPDGYPIYFATENQAAAKSTRALQLNTGGSLGLNLNGQGMVARVWDGGKVRTTHNYFGGRVESIDDPSGTTYVAHATHVTGTVLADGPTSIRGMAYQATGRTFDWTDDESEVLSEVLEGMLVSNHSYGVPVTSQSGTTLPAWYIGTYSQDAANWDEIAYLSPYYLMVVSAGNDGLNQNNAEPISYGYDKLVGNKTAKNNLIVANAQDASVDAVGNLTAAVAINTSSSQGPTDDRRIKPDITGNGTGLTSTTSTSNTATTSMTGTSMASPNVAGTLILLQQHYNNLTTKFMKAATLKGLACHTADDAGTIGPDAIFGWGLLNAKAAAQAITGNGLSAWISEQNLNQGQSFTMNVKALGTTPLAASITWTDVPGDPNNGERAANDLTKALVNDLDIRITRNATTYFPWKLNDDITADAIRTQDNAIDNVELVKIDSPVANGDYTITITHKGNLVTGKQNYSLVITGLTSTFALVPTSDDLTVCANQNAVYTFNYTQSSAMTTTFSATGLPSGATAVFSPTSRNSNGPVTMTISNLTNVTPGSYNVGIVGNNGTESETRTRQLNIYSNTFSAIALNTPTNNQTTVATTVNLTWNANTNAENYNLQVSTSPTFATLFLDVNTLNTSYIVSGLSQETYYYWRVLPTNRCGNAPAASATVYRFQTGVLSCGNVFTATDFSNATIATTANATATIPVTVGSSLTIGDINVELNITHTYIQDFKVYLTGPASIGSPVITLLSEPCGDNDNVNCVMDDSGDPVLCTSTAPALTGNVIPFESLSTFNGLNAQGTWTLTVVDAYNGDGGVVNSVKLNICSITPPLSIEDNMLSELKIYPNPTSGIINIDLGSIVLDNKSVIKLYDIQGRMITTKEMNSSVDQLNISDLSEGVYMITIENGSSKTTKKIVLSK
ncbi:S8 family serine peptidase [Flavobacterium urocaniciphilum]|uniref:Por secretion system C-terminal sorting domain-containing protein n=1 Tax=Flavobacterium urocaniciphilum TaxID=1299341 RepID=A0A1H9BKU6_9FLAO|nr:S8 family serine peptidase [Flavobacterium urocaniciphilum]SEP89610.1 Por secretion system C-terminal sorting domain-containing protein [Flavobacterium urocaniciphilum]